MKRATSLPKVILLKAPVFSLQFHVHTYKNKYFSLNIVVLEPCDSPGIAPEEKIVNYLFFGLTASFGKILGKLFSMRHPSSGLGKGAGN